MSREDRHLTEVELARLVGGPMRRTPDAFALDHLSGCRSCFAAYADAVRMTVDSIRGGPGVQPPVDLVQQARSIAGRAAPKRQPPPTRARPSWSWVGVLAAAALAGLALLAPGRDRELPLGAVLEEATWEPARRALAAESARTLVYPDFEEHSADPVEVLRSGNAIAPGLRSVENAFSAALASRPDSPDVAASYASVLLAQHRWSVAARLLQGTLQQHPEHSRLLHLRAIAAYHSSDMERAADLLQRVWLRKRTPAAGIDLAIVWIEQGRKDAAQALLRELCRKHAGSPVEQRSVHLLARIQGS